MMRPPLISCFLAFAVVILLRLSPAARGDLIVDTMGVACTEDFESFTGAGFAPSPSAGQLDSDSWRVTGFSEGDSAWRDVKTTANTDFARGSDPGDGVHTGGVYAFALSGNTVFGVQPGGNDFAPGTIQLRVRNETGATVPSWDISYDIFYRNDQDRANSFNLSYSANGSPYVGVPALDFISPEAKEDPASFASVARSTTISASVNNTEYLYLKWSGDDVSGGDHRDEFGLDNVSITPNPEPGTLLMGALTSLGFLTYGFARRRASRRRRE